MPFPSADGVALALRRSGFGANPLQWRLPPIETYPTLIAFNQTLAGKLVLFAIFAALIKPLAGSLWLPLTIAVAVVALAGRYRRQAAFVSTAALLIVNPDWYEFRAVYAVAAREELLDTLHPVHVRTATLTLGLALAAAAIFLARRFANHLLGRRPVLAQHILFCGLLAMASSSVVQGVSLVLLWGLLAALAAYFWFIAYALVDQRQRDPAPGFFHLATFHPFFVFGSTPIPMGKGAANWLRVEARSPDELSVTQLKGLKLLIWAYVLKGVLWAYRGVVYDDLGIPTLSFAFGTFVSLGEAPPGALGLLSMLANFPEQLLNLAVMGHVTIATARLAGFRLLRNTWRPLSSRSIAEFWNRYFYYFKEILVNIYFYPTYVRWFKGHPRIRIAFATCVAAGVGNFFFHFILNNHLIPQNGLLGALAQMQTYAFYCTVLVGGIVISQLRAYKPDENAGWLRRQFLPSLGVAVFYCFLSFFDSPDRRNAPLAQHFEFLFQILGVG